MALTRDSIRPLAPEDIPQVAELRRRVFGASLSGVDFAELFLRSPFRNDAIPALVLQDDGGEITGFLGVTSRRMVLRSRPVHMAIASHFMVDPDRRGLAGLRLLKRFMEGPQDLSITDGANDATRKIWEGRGGATAFLYSLYWVRPLRPAQFAFALSRKYIHLPGVAAVLRPLLQMGEALVARRLRNAFHVAVPQDDGGELDEATMLARLPEFASDRSLRPVYDERSLSWILQRASRWTDRGRFEKVQVRDERGDLAGWYLWHVNPEGIGDVLQIAAKKTTVRFVLERLFHDAWRKGAIAVTGRLEPAFIQELSDQRCLFYRRGPWMLVHANDPEVLRVIHRGDAFLTRLEGEWDGRG